MSYGPIIVQWLNVIWNPSRTQNERDAAITWLTSKLDSDFTKLEVENAELKKKLEEHGEQAS